MRLTRQFKRVVASGVTFLFLMTVPAAAFSGTAAGGGPQYSVPPLWLAIPFALLLLMIATGPLFYPVCWERHHRKISITLGSLVSFWYAFMFEQGGQVLLHALEEYLSFIALISSLFVVAGGILIRIGWRGSPLVNGLLLLSGAVLANAIGTTGASMLLIRPYLKINEGRVKGFHIVFFIFIVSNIGGGLTPIGDPPLFLGFLRGVPFFWMLRHLWIPWLLTILLLCLIFMALDARVGNTSGRLSASRGISISGSKNFLYLCLLIVSVFIDPSIIAWVPSLQKLFLLPFGIREVIMAVVAFVAYRSADRAVLKSNDFNFEPLREVAFLFAGIFATMIPALQLIGVYTRSHAGDFTVTKFYWLTGMLSGVLDNAPTYLNFFSGALGKFDLDAGSRADVMRFVSGVHSAMPGDVSSQQYLMAISIASVFFGALTYIGNAPNFMVRNIADQTDADVPGFIAYVFRYSIPVLLPIFAVLWFVLFNV
jgi:Na+/H+ antiporter NhaD/arsenite permease-like protein